MRHGGAARPRGFPAGSGAMMRSLEVLRTVLRNRRGHVGPPRMMTYTVTFTCNARCIMCDSWKKPSPNDLTLEELERIFDQLPRLDGVRLTGGEPFVRKDMLQIAHLAQDKLKPMYLHITSNGFLTDRIVRFAEDRKKDIPVFMLVSVDGVKEKHNHVRGRTTAWDSVMKTLHALAPRQKELNMHLAVNQTIVDAEGAAHYRKLRDILKPLGVYNNVVMAYDASATYNVKDEVELAPTEIGQFTTFGEDFTDDVLKQLLNDVETDLIELPLAQRKAKEYYVRGIRNRLLGNTGEPNPKCVALNTHFRLFPNGDVPTCQFNTKKVGNLRHQSFEEIWYGASDKMGRQRDWVKKCPGCWAECEVLPNSFYTGDLIREAISPTRPAPAKQRHHRTRSDSGGYGHSPSNQP